MPARGPITVESPLAPDALVFVSMHGVEALGRPFEYVVDLVSEDPNISLGDLLGQPLTVKLELDGGEHRCFHGLVTEVDFAESSGPRAVYRVTIRPWLALLENTTNCRIFQTKSIPEILKEIFRDRGFTDFEEALTGEYSKNDYVVQYRESDFNFISRLCEDAGIYYFFRHSESAHTLVLSDAVSAHKRTPGCEQLPYAPHDENRLRLEEYVDTWRLTKRLTPGSVALRDFDFEKPNADLSASLAAPKEHARADYEVYDYPAAYRVRSDGEKQARLRLEQRHERHEQVRGHTNARGFTLGALFELSSHPRDDQNREYLITMTELTLSGHQLETGPSDEPFTFSCDFSSIDSKVPFRSAANTKKPTVEGPQTAIVVGKAGEEIWTDKYGRVKVQFHWDRLGERNESSSCWVRVAQAWAGSNWGSIHVPRMGQEVIVDFLEGDPDRPIITGRVYNGSNMPPYGLPGSATQSGIKSRSSKGGGAANANEIRMEDRKGSEEFFVQAEKDMNSVIKHNETRSVGVDRTVSIGANETKSVGANETITVGGNEARTVKGNETIDITKNETVTIGGNESKSVKGNETVSITGNDTLTVTGAQHITVKASRDEKVMVSDTITVVGARSLTAAAHTVTVGKRTKTVATSETVTIGTKYGQTVGGAASISITGARTESVGGDSSITVKGGHTLSVTKAGALSFKKTLVIDATDEIVLKSGEASITLKKNGDIAIKGKNITLEGSGKIGVKASSDLTLKGSKIGQN